ncbi:hypothetical protein [Mammaliicoccus fleurettii]|uniref:hypothetical protein n=1 Tax=Mammaliicoccus fleurettii TaxID=150056 RepID=UPI000E05896F|nr:hypothetical protein [Mammaliicoccus fleurettii]RTX87957.1 hypothetical protein CD129_07945 [Mammaliicoccus fleurettii]SUM36992.1 putative lipoprotein [Mammaliicoccus fleurettii]HCN60607.1 hypothetical protein [Staphylococcus sp.]
MKKLLVLLFVSLLVLGACGQKEKSTKEESTKEAKKEVKKDNPKKENASKKEDKDNKSEPKTEEQSTEDINTTEQPTQEQSLTKEEMVQKFKNGENVDGQVDAEGNTYVQGQGGGDAMGYYKPDGSFCTVGGCVSPESQEQQDVPSDNSYIQEGQDWRNNTGTGLSSGEMQLKQQILDGTYEGQDEEEVLEAIEYYEQQYGQ